ncbi:B-cell receptor CD22-like [Anneissia japonica]|uniref:B-cell receptor CD22-like n=1 Tax=Anneissia japonica TaxID=1529436 RepID=UPI0014256E9A|nr:B-cell receptor CD22-like [Anneissia japonica]
MSCDYSQVSSTLKVIRWDEVNEDLGSDVRGIVNDRTTVNGRYSLRQTPGNADLVISKPGRNDSGRRFRCQIQKSDGAFIISRDAAILTVYYLDQPLVTASKSIVDEGQPVTMTCNKPDSDPVPNNITWYKNGKALNTIYISKFTTSARNSLEIHIEAATADDGGYYTCKAESDQFKGKDGKTSAQFELRVIEYCTYFTLCFILS